MSNSESAITVIQDIRKDLETLCTILNKWIPIRKDVRQQLTLLADELKKHQRNVYIAQVTGSSTAIVGAGLVIGGFAASFFTFGVSLIISAVGAGVGGVGGLTSAGAGITQYFLNKNIYKSAQAAIDRDQEITDELQACLESLKIKLESFKENRSLCMPLMDKCSFGFNVASSLKLLGKNLVYDLVKAGRLATASADLAADVSTTIFKTLSTAGRVIHIGGFVVGMVLMPLDIYTLVTSSIGLHKGNTSDAEKQIRKIIREMMCPEQEDISGIVERILTEMLDEN